MIEISKELLSEVLNETKVILDYEVSIDNTEIHWGHKDIDEDGFISIYELAFKCKEWALSKGIMLVSGYYPNGNIYCSTNNILKGTFNESRADTEVKAIIKAC